MISKDQFNELYATHYPKVYGLCLGYMKGDEHLSKDLTQEVFIKIWQHHKNFKNESNISTWIYRIAVNTCLQQLRRKRFLPIIAETSDSIDQENYSLNKEHNFKKMYECIDKLSHENKSIILLELENIPQNDIADIIGCSHAAIRTRIHRIKNQLSKCVKNE